MENGKSSDSELGLIWQPLLEGGRVGSVVMMNYQAKRMRKIGEMLSAQGVKNIIPCIAAAEGIAMKLDVGPSMINITQRFEGDTDRLATCMVTINFVNEDVSLWLYQERLFPQGKNMDWKPQHLEFSQVLPAASSKISGRLISGKTSVAWREMRRHLATEGSLLGVSELTVLIRPEPDDQRTVKVDSISSFRVKSSGGNDYVQLRVIERVKE